MKSGSNTTTNPTTNSIERWNKVEQIVQKYKIGQKPPNKLGSKQNTLEKCPKRKGMNDCSK